MQLLFGEPRSPSDLGKPVSGKLDLVEVLIRPGRTPKPARLAQLRSNQRPELSLSVLAGEEVLGADAASAIDLVARSVEALSARSVVVRVPASLRPGQQSERRIQGTLSALADACSAEILFEATGLWQPPATRALCRSWGVGRVLRFEELATELEPGPKPYLRVVQLGTGRTRFHKYIDAVAATLSQCDSACVVVEGGSAASVRQAVSDALIPFEQDDVE
jgi:hypothetical protein